MKYEMGVLLMIDNDLGLVVSLTFIIFPFVIHDFRLLICCRNKNISFSFMRELHLDSSGSRIHTGMDKMGGDFFSTSSGSN